MRGGRVRTGGIGGFLRVEGFRRLVDGAKGEGTFFLLLPFKSCTNESNEFKESKNERTTDRIKPKSVSLSCSGHHVHFFGFNLFKTATHYNAV
jgi:hypothetical protein